MFSLEPAAVRAPKTTYAKLQGAPSRLQASSTFTCTIKEVFKKTIIKKYPEGIGEQVNN